MEKIFVYGTLKGRVDEFGAGENKPKFLGEARIEGWDMYRVSSFPAIVKGEGTVYGELWEVDESTLRKLDHYEGVPELYTRQQVNVLTKDGKVTKAWVYVASEELRPHLKEKIESGVW